MGWLKLSVQRKNKRRKKYGVYLVHISRRDVNIMRIPIPLHAESFIALCFS
jgi:hypothetical protein